MPDEVQTFSLDDEGVEDPKKSFDALGIKDVDMTGAQVNPLAQAFANDKLSELFNADVPDEVFGNSINLQNPIDTMYLNTPAPYSNADLGNFDFIKRM